MAYFEQSTYREKQPNYAAKLLEIKGVTQGMIVERLRAMGVNCTQATISRIKNGKHAGTRKPISKDTLEGLERLWSQRGIYFCDQIRASRQ